MKSVGHRADVVYKDILKFHVHGRARIGVMRVPRHKWISSGKTNTNCAATMKALAVADTYMSVDALIAVAYDWARTDRWDLVDDLS